MLWNREPRIPTFIKRLADRRSERQPLLKDVERLRRAHETSMPEPTEEWAAEQLQCLSATLSGGGPAAAHALRDLVGGKIFVKQIERPNRKRHYLQGRFAIRLASVVDIASGGRLVSAPGDEGAGDHQVEFVIDFVEPDLNDALAETAKRYYDQGLHEQGDRPGNGHLAQPGDQAAQTLVSAAWPVAA